MGNQNSFSDLDNTQKVNQGLGSQAGAITAQRFRSIGQYVVGMLSQKKEAVKLLNEFFIYLQDGNSTNEHANSLVEACRKECLQYNKESLINYAPSKNKTIEDNAAKNKKESTSKNRQVENIKKNTGLDKIKFFKSEKQSDKTSVYDNKPKINSDKTTNKKKHDNNIKTLFQQSTNKDKNKEKESNKLRKSIIN